MLDKAENLVKKGKFEKAIIQINNAQNSQYCTCGDCARQVNTRIYLLRYSINFKLEQFDFARKYLDSISYSNLKIDSLKVLSYQAEYGKKYLSEKLDSSLISAKLFFDESEYCTFVKIPILGGNHSLKFKINQSIFSEYPGEESDEVKLERWRKKFMESPIYSMLKNKD